MEATRKQMRYFKYAMRDCDEIFDWYSDQDQAHRIDLCHARFMDIMSKAFFNKQLSVEQASEIIGAHKRDDFATIKKVVEGLVVIDVK